MLAVQEQLSLFCLVNIVSRLNYYSSPKSIFYVAELTLGHGEHGRAGRHGGMHRGREALRDHRGAEGDIGMCRGIEGHKAVHVGWGCGGNAKGHRGAQVRS